MMPVSNLPRLKPKCIVNVSFVNTYAQSFTVEFNTVKSTCKGLMICCCTNVATGSLFYQNVYFDFLYGFLILKVNHFGQL